MSGSSFSVIDVCHNFIKPQAWEPFNFQLSLAHPRGKFWREFSSLKPTQFRLLFPSLAAGMNDFEVEAIQLGLTDEFYRSELPGQILDAARDANELLKDYTVGRVLGIVGIRRSIVNILGRGAGLSAEQMDFLNDAFALKAFADQQRVNVTQLSDLADILNQNGQTIDEALANLRN